MSFMRIQNHLLFFLFHIPCLVFRVMHQFTLQVYIPSSVLIYLLSLLPYFSLFLNILIILYLLLYSSFKYASFNASLIYDSKVLSIYFVCSIYNWRRTKEIKIILGLNIFFINTFFAFLYQKILILILIELY